MSRGWIEIYSMLHLFHDVLSLSPSFSKLFSSTLPHPLNRTQSSPRKIKCSSIVRYLHPSLDATRVSMLMAMKIPSNVDSGSSHRRLVIRSPAGFEVSFSSRIAILVYQKFPLSTLFLFSLFWGCKTIFTLVTAFSLLSPAIGGWGYQIFHSKSTLQRSQKWEKKNLLRNFCVVWVSISSFYRK